MRSLEKLSCNCEAVFGQKLRQRQKLKTRLTSALAQVKTTLENRLRLLDHFHVLFICFHNIFSQNQLSVLQTLLYNSIAVRLTIQSKRLPSRGGACVGTLR